MSDVGGVAGDMDGEYYVEPVTAFNGWFNRLYGQGAHGGDVNFLMSVMPDQMEYLIPMMEHQGMALRIEIGLVLRKKDGN